MRGNNGEQMKAFVDEFNESQNEIIVRESEQGMYDEAYTKLMQVVGTDEAPDIMQMGKLRETLDARMITPMQEFVEADDDFDVDTLLPAVRAEYTVEDALQFMPQAASNNVIFFNVDAFEEAGLRSEEHTSELQSRGHLVCRLLLEKQKTALDAR